MPASLLPSRPLALAQAIAAGSGLAAALGAAASAFAWWGEDAHVTRAPVATAVALAAWPALLAWTARLRGVTRPRADGVASDVGALAIVGLVVASTFPAMLWVLAPRFAFELLEVRYEVRDLLLAVAVGFAAVCAVAVGPEAQRRRLQGQGMTREPVAELTTLVPPALVAVLALLGGRGESVAVSALGVTSLLAGLAAGILVGHRAARRTRDLRAIAAGEWTGLRAVEDGGGALRLVHVSTSEGYREAPGRATEILVGDSVSADAPGLAARAPALTASPTLSVLQALTLATALSAVAAQASVAFTLPLAWSLEIAAVGALASWPFAAAWLLRARGVGAPRTDGIGSDLVGLVVASGMAVAAWKVLLGHLVPDAKLSVPLDGRVLIAALGTYALVALVTLGPERARRRLAARGVLHEARGEIPWIALSAAIAIVILVTGDWSSVELATSGATLVGCLLAGVVAARRAVDRRELLAALEDGSTRHFRLVDDAEARRLVVDDGERSFEIVVERPEQAWPSQGGRDLREAFAPSTFTALAQVAGTTLAAYVVLAHFAPRLVLWSLALGTAVGWVRWLLPQRPVRASLVAFAAVALTFWAVSFDAGAPEVVRATIAMGVSLACGLFAAVAARRATPGRPMHLGADAVGCVGVLALGLGVPTVQTYVAAVPLAVVAGCATAVGAGIVLAWLRRTNATSEAQRYGLRVADDGPRVVEPSEEPTEEGRLREVMRLP